MIFLLIVTAVQQKQRDKGEQQCNHFFPTILNVLLFSQWVGICLTAADSSLISSILTKLLWPVCFWVFPLGTKGSKHLSLPSC